MLALRDIPIPYDYVTSTLRRCSLPHTRAHVQDAKGPEHCPGPRAFAVETVTASALSRQPSCAGKLTSRRLRPSAACEARRSARAYGLAVRLAHGLDDLVLADARKVARHGRLPVACHVEAQRPRQNMRVRQGLRLRALGLHSINAKRNAVRQQCKPLIAVQARQEIPQGFDLTRHPPLVFRDVHGWPFRRCYHRCLEHAC